MGKRLQAVFEKTLCDIKEADGDEDALGVVFEQITQNVLSLPQREVPKGIRAFFTEWKKRSDALEAQVNLLAETEMSENSTEEDARKALDDIDKFVGELKSFQAWVVASAPASVPGEIISVFNNSVDAAVFEVKSQVEIMKGLLALTDIFSVIETKGEDGG